MKNILFLRIRQKDAGLEGVNEGMQQKTRKQDTAAFKAKVITNGNAIPIGTQLGIGKSHQKQPEGRDDLGMSIPPIVELTACEQTMNDTPALRLVSLTKTLSY